MNDKQGITLPSHYGEGLGVGLYGLIGYPLGHSFSRRFFTEEFDREGIDAEYLNFEIEHAEQLLDIVRQHPTLRGLNCTIPHKQAIIPLLDEVSDEARAIGAVNVISLTPRPPQEGGSQVPGVWMKGFNSDVIGFTESLRPLLQPHHKQALVLGTGGASKAICAGLESLGIGWEYVSRKPLEGHLTYADLTAETLRNHTLIVNCTPLGMYPHVDTAPDIPYSALTERHLLYDLVYNPEETRFMRLGRAQGTTVKNGLEMLHLQALASWEFWHPV